MDLQQKPEALAVAFDNIPQVLIDLPQWLVWRYTWVEKGKAKWSKVPYNVRTNRPAQSNNRETWVPFEQAKGAYLRGKESGQWDGIGFCFAEGDGLVGVDLDHVLNKDTGEIDPKALQVLAMFANTYSEVSPSGTGFRIYAFGKAVRSGKATGKDKWIEIYDWQSPRYLTVTGQHWLGAATEISEQQQAIEALHRLWFAKEEKTLPPVHANATTKPSGNLDDQALIEKACKAKNGDKFRRLWEGDCSAFVDQDGAFDRSSAVASLLAMLAYWTAHDSARMDRLFRQSGLYAMNVDKWDVKHRSDGATYGQMSIEYGIKSSPKVYEPRSPHVANTAKDGGLGGSEDASGGGNKMGREADESGDDRPTVHIGGDRLVTAMQQAERILFKGKNPPFYQRGGMLMRMQSVDRPIDEQGNIKRESGSIVLMPVTEEWLVRGMMQKIKFLRFNDKTEKLIATNLPTGYAKSYIHSGEWWAPVLRGISQVPVMRMDGSIHTRPGFDAASGIYLDSVINWKMPPERRKGEKIDPVQDDAIRWACNTLMDLFESFGPATPSDLAAMVSAILTGLVKSEIGASPGLAVSAPVFGTGKGKIVHIISIVLTGQPAPMMTWTEKEEELEKQLFASLLAGDRIVAIDEVRTKMKSKMLDSMLTETVKSGRVLSLSKNAIVRPSDSMYFAIGNNISIPADSSRRWLRGYIDPQCESPHLRVFDRDVIQYASKNRVKIVCAALTLLHGFFFAGKPNPGVSLGSFERWSDTVRCALIWAGMGDPCESMKGWLEVDSQKQSLAGLLLAWYRRYGTKPMSTAKIVEETENDKELTNTEPLWTALYEVCGEKKGLNRQKLNYILRSEKGRFVSVDLDDDSGNPAVKTTLRVMADGTKRNVTQWKIERLDG